MEPAEEIVIVLSIWWFENNVLSDSAHHAEKDSLPRGRPSLSVGKIQPLDSATLAGKIAWLSGFLVHERHPVSIASSLDVVLFD